MDLPEICKPEEVAQFLRWNKQAVLKAVRSGRLKGSRLSQKQIIIRREDVIQFMEDACQSQTKDLSSSQEATGRGSGKSGNMFRESGGDGSRALLALKQRRMKEEGLKTNVAEVSYLNFRSAE